MAHAVELCLDRAGEARLYRLWDALEAVGVPTLRSHTHRRHRPHISYAVLDAVEPAVAVDLLAEPCADGGPFAVELSYVGVFPRGVLFLGVTVTADLLRRHAAVWRALTAGGLAVWDHYRPGAWVPHCTLSMRVPADRTSAAVRPCYDILPLRLTADTAGVVDTATGRIVELPGVP